MFFTSVFLFLIVSFLLLVNHWSQNKGIIYLVLLILILCARQLTLLLLSTTLHVNILTALIIHTDPLTALTGPLLLYYIFSLVKGKQVMNTKFFLHAIPALLILFNTIPFYFFPWENKLAFFSIVQHHIPYTGLNHFPYLFVPFNFQRTGLVFFNLSYAIYSIWYLINLKRSSPFYLKKKASTIISYLLILIPAFILPNLVPIFYATMKAKNENGLVFRDPAFQADGYLFFLILVLPLSFFLMPSWLYNDRGNLSLIHKCVIWYKKLTYKTSGFLETSFEKSDDLERIVNYIEKEKPYVNTAFSLHDISRSLNIPHIRVTTCFSKQLKVSFPTYRNKLRVEHATELFRSGAHLNTSIEGIAAMSGFKSKSIFYTAFKAEYGVNPMEWIKENV
jgi:AraC-like DNA-binding protein